jgi:ABC-2 type transport system ATP-binding protein
MITGTGGLAPPRQSWGAFAVRLSYHGNLALDGVSVAVAAGQVTAVVGGDGAGKTSLLRCLAGAAKPDSGEVRRPAKSRIGFLPASSGVYPDLTVAENLAFRGAGYGLRADVAARRATELTEQAGLATARDRLAAKLSGGMRQKLGVIAALLHRPDLLILDEPGTGVDPVSRSGLWWLIASAAADGAAVILATTYLDDAQRAAEVLVLDDGRPLASGTPDQITLEMPGSVRAVSSRPPGTAADRGWRRGASWRVWWPPGIGGADEAGALGSPAKPDLQDAVIVAALARQLTALPQVAAPPDAPPGQRGHQVPERQRPERQTPLQQTPVQQTQVQQTPVRRAPVRQTPVHGYRTPQRSAGPLVESIAVTCRFGSVAAVRDVSIAVQPGEIVGLLGANGAGKTTLIRMLLGLIPATTGQVRLLGEPPSRVTRRRIGYVPQGLGLYEDLTAAENMAFAAAVFGDSSASFPAQDDLPGAVSRAALPVGQLPLGLQRRVAFAQALAHRPDVLILDEPTSGVDPLGRARLWQTIAAAVESGAGALVSTHYMEEAQECDRLIIMADGIVVAAGTAQQIIGDAKVAVVDSGDWATAFTLLERAGLSVSLAGRTLRVPGAGPDQVRRVLPASYHVHAEPGTLEERFFQLLRLPSQDRAPG